MAMIDEQHVEWRVVARLRELLDHPPGAEHDVTLTYALFTAILCWACQRIRDRGRPVQVWRTLQGERASAQPWGVLDLQAEQVVEGPLAELPADIFLFGLRDAVAHGDDRTVRPLPISVAGRADQRLAGFIFEADFYAPGQQRKREPPIWGQWRLSLTKLDMRRIGLALADRFCAELDEGARQDAERHVLVA